MLLCIVNKRNLFTDKVVLTESKYSWFHV